MGSRLSNPPIENFCATQSTVVSCIDAAITARLRSIVASAGRKSSEGSIFVSRSPGRHYIKCWYEFPTPRFVGLATGMYAFPGVVSI